MTRAESAGLAIIGVGADGMKEKVMGGLAVAAALAVVYVFAMPTYRQGEPSVAGRSAPDFAVDINGHQGRLSELRGKVVVLDFWASWCPPCVEEAPSLNALQQRIADEGGIVLGISQDDDAGAYDHFLADQHIVFPTYRDTTSAYPALGKIATNYGTALLPDVYLISRDGRIARKIVGPQDWDSPELVSTIETLLHATVGITLQTCFVILSAAKDLSARTAKKREILRRSAPQNDSTLLQSGFAQS